MGVQDKSKDKDKDKEKENNKDKEKNKKTKFTDAFPPARAEDLPAEERWQLEETGEKPGTELSKEDMDMLNMSQQQVASSSSTKKEQITDPAMLAYAKMRDSSTQSVAYWTQFDTFNIEMTNGQVIKYKRLPISELDFDELEQLRAQVEGYSDLGGNRLSNNQLYHLSKLWKDKQGEYYLFNTKTKKMMTQAERLSCKYSSVIRNILAACQMRSMSEAPEGKK